MKTSQTILCTLALASAASAQAARVPSAGVAARFWWSDYDGDGDLDALVLHPGAGLQLLAGFGDGSFEDVTARAGLGGFEGVSQALWNDLDGDALAELLVVVPAGASRLLRLERGSFVDVTASAGLAPASGVRYGEWVDVDGDGRDDLHLSTARGELVLHNLGGVRFETLDLGVAPLDVAWSRELLAWIEEGRALEVPEVEGGELASTSGLSAAGAGSTPGRTAAAATPYCWDLLKDQGTGNCLTASSVPTVGSLFPLSQQFNIDFAGRVGIGTLNPGAALDVVGSIRADQQLISTAASGPPLAVSSTDLVPSLNADLLDGLHASEINLLGASIGTPELEDAAVTSAKLAADSVGATQITDGAVGAAELAQDAVGSDEILDGSITGVDLALGAISGTTIQPDFGAQLVVTTGKGIFGKELDAEPFAVKGLGIGPPTRGYLGVQGFDDYDGVAGVDLAGLEIGVLGVSEGGSTSDNYGVLGQATEAGVRGQSSADPSNFGELGRIGIGVRGEGTTSGGRFDGDFFGGQFFGGLYGVHAQTADSTGVGVWGISSSTSGSTHGVFGSVGSTSGTGVYGNAASPSGTTYGVFGHSSSTSGRGVRGETTATSGTNYGVQGRTHSPSGYGIISYGASGSTGQKNFIQPHPTDPTREIHFTSLEGNESGTYFRGSSTLVGGRVEIDVPESFRLVSESEELTVQLTPRGPGADLWVVSVDLDRVVVQGAWDAEFDYQINGVRRGFREHRTFRQNHAYVPEERGVAFATELPEDVRRILVENGILNADFTPNEATAAALGWELREPVDEAAREAGHRAARAARKREQQALANE